MMKIVVKLDYHDDKGKQKAMMAVSSMRGIVSIAIDGKDKNLTLIGDVDPIMVVSKLRKVCCADIVTAGPPEKKNEKEPKKGDKEQEEPKKEPKKDDIQVNEHIQRMVKAYEAYNPHLTTYYAVHSAEEDPNACVIC